MRIRERVVSWLRRQVASAGADGLVFGLSGGVDSAVVGVLAREALGTHALGVLLPCESVARDRADALTVARCFDIPTVEFDLTATYRLLMKLLSKGSRTAGANLKARLRMLVLYYLANARNCLVAGTGNRSELMVGYFTKYGDGGVDILPIGDLLKTEVRELAKELGVPNCIIRKPPSAGLWSGQTDETELGVTYERLDAVLRCLNEVVGKPQKTTMEDKVLNMVGRSRHKRRMPQMPRFQ